MGLILGFGRTEKEEQQKIKAALITGAANGLTSEYVLDEWEAWAAFYDKMPRGQAPERYTMAYFYEGNLHFQHTNREHPFSPDGWAGFFVEEPFAIPQTANIEG